LRDRKPDEGLESITPCGHAPSSALIEQRRWLSEEMAWGMQPESKFVEQRQGMIGAIR
jgi:hypothetical protein